MKLLMTLQATNEQVSLTGYLPYSLHAYAISVCNKAGCVLSAITAAYTLPSGTASRSVLYLTSTDINSSQRQRDLMAFTDAVSFSNRTVLYSTFSHLNKYSAS